ncbi:MAG TPA: hypothetical protein PKD27_01205, partial [Tepidiformaceae bacterium]|nr:hypothetical protein [Tepidiformaceae bacterium]
MRTPIACVVLAISLSLLACGSEEKRGTVAIAFHLHEPGATLFIGNPADHTLVLEPGTYRIVAVNHDDRVTAFEQFTLSQPSQVRLATGYDLHDPQLARDIRQVARALLRIDHARLLSLEAASTGFTVPLFTDAHPTLADTVTRIERMNAALAAAAAETHAMEAALSRIDTFGSPPSAKAASPPLSVSIRPALTFGVFDAIKDKLLGFFRFAGAAGERAAADIARVAEELSPDQREDAFLDVAPGLTGGARNFDELLQKLQSGELNSSAAQVRAQLWANAEFSSAAQNVCNCNNPALTTAHTEGAELVTKGAELNVQVIKTVLGDVFPGISDGFDYADKADEWAEYLRDVYQDPLGQLDAAARAAIAERLKERILGDMEGCCPLLDEEDLDAA